MRFAYGCTRWVILTNRYAIKFARFRPIRPFVQLFKLLLKKEVVKSLGKYDANPIRGGLKYLLAGIVANRAEYRIYKRYPSDLLVPTLVSIYGLVNIQRRGEPAAEEEVRSHYLWHLLKNTSIVEDLPYKQFCKIDSRVCLADYGRDYLETILAESSIRI